MEVLLSQHPISFFSLKITLIYSLNLIIIQYLLDLQIFLKMINNQENDLVL